MSKTLKNIFFVTHVLTLHPVLYGQRRDTRKNKTET